MEIVLDTMAQDKHDDAEQALNPISQESTGAIRTLIMAFENRIVDWAIAFFLVVLIAGALIVGTLIVSAYMTSKSPEQAVRWGWLDYFMHDVPPLGFEPLVCEASQAESLTALYRETLNKTSFKLVEVQFKKLNTSQVEANAYIRCMLGDTAHEEAWRAIFDTRFDWPLGVCIEQINVSTHAAMPCPLN